MLRPAGCKHIRHKHTNLLYEQNNMIA